MILPFLFYILQFSHPVQFIVDREQFMNQNREYIDRPVQGLIAVTKDSTWFKLDSTYVSFANFKYTYNRRYVQASFKKDRVFGSIYGTKEVLYVEFHQPKVGNVQVKYRCKASSLEP